MHRMLTGAQTEGQPAVVSGIGPVLVCAEIQGWRQRCFPGVARWERAPVDQAGWRPIAGGSIQGDP